MSEIYYPDKENRIGNDLPVLVDHRETPDRESMLYSYQNTVEESYSGDFRVYVKKFGDYLRSSKSQVYDPAKESFIDIPIRYAAPQYAFSDNLPLNSTGAVPEASLTDRVALPLVSFYLADTDRDDTRAIDPCVRARYKPAKAGNNPPEYSRALVSHAPIPINYQFQVDIWTEFREHYYQLLTAFYNDFNPYSYLYDVYDMADETQKLQYTSYVPMFLDSVVDNSNFVPGSDRRIVRGTLRITVKGWLTPPVKNKPYVHETITQLNTETITSISENNTLGKVVVSSALDTETTMAQIGTVFGRTGTIVSKPGDYNDSQITMTDSMLGSNVSEALTRLATDVNIESATVLAEAIPAFTCFTLRNNIAYIVKSTGTGIPVVDGITLESGIAGDKIRTCRHVGGTYVSTISYPSGSLLYLGQSGELTTIPPTYEAGDVYLLIVGKGSSGIQGPAFTFNPHEPIRLLA